MINVKYIYYYSHDSTYTVIPLDLQECLSVCMKTLTKLLLVFPTSTNIRPSIVWLVCKTNTDFMFISETLEITTIAKLLLNEFVRE